MSESGRGHDGLKVEQSSEDLDYREPSLAAVKKAVESKTQKESEGEQGERDFDTEWSCS